MRQYVYQCCIPTRWRPHIGALAFSRTGNPDTMVFEDAVVLKTFGRIPGDLAMLIYQARRMITCLYRNELIQ